MEGGLKRDGWLPTFGGRKDEQSKSGRSPNPRRLIAMENRYLRKSAYPPVPVMRVPNRIARMR